MKTPRGQKEEQSVCWPAFPFLESSQAPLLSVGSQRARAVLAGAAGTRRFCAAAMRQREELPCWLLPEWLEQSPSGGGGGCPRRCRLCEDVNSP